MDELNLTLSGFAPTRDEYERAVRVVRALTEQLAAVTGERDAAAANFLHASKEWQTAGDERDATFIVASLQQNRADKAEAERNAARAEVVKRTTIMQSVAQKVELWIHDTDQFSPRTSAEDMVVQDGQLEELSQIVKALRGDTAPVQPAALCECGHPVERHGIGGCIHLECECEITSQTTKE